MIALLKEEKLRLKSRVEFSSYHKDTLHLRLIHPDDSAFQKIALNPSSTRGPFINNVRTNGGGGRVTLVRTNENRGEGGLD